MEITIYNNNNSTSATINSFGAELISLKNILTNTEYIWQRDPKFWAKSSPILFPFIGVLKNNQYYFEGKQYNFPKKHGFARDFDFEIYDKKNNFVSFRLSTSQTIKEYFPFNFNLFINYTLEKNLLRIEYIIENLDKKDMYFSIGNHPAFNIPTDNNTLLSDYYLEFSEKEDKDLYFLTDSLFNSMNKIESINHQILNLNSETFKNDVLIVKNINSKKVYLKNYKTPFKLIYKFEGFKHLGIWSKPQANFICLEAWNGLPDDINHSGNLIQKEDIEKLIPHKKYRKKIEIEIQ